MEEAWLPKIIYEVYLPIYYEQIYWISFFIHVNNKILYNGRPRLDAWDKRWDLVLWEDLEGAGGEGGGRGDRNGEDMWTQGLFISMYEKIHYK